MCISRKVKKSESKSQLETKIDSTSLSCVYPVKLKNLKANHNLLLRVSKTFPLCISRKVKKSESKSQHGTITITTNNRCVYPVKLKNLKANHNNVVVKLKNDMVVYIP